MSVDQPLFHGTRAKLAAGAEIAPAAGFTYASPNLDDAIWSAELSDGDGVPRVYRVEATGAIADAREASDFEAPRHPAMSWRSTEPLRVVDEVTSWTHYHGTRAALTVGDLIKPGHAANFGATERTANFVYFARTLDAAVWGAELARGDGEGRIYIVEPTGDFEDDPNLTDAKFRGNPTKSFRSRHPLRIVGSLDDWPSHPEDAVKAMREGLARMTEAGVEPNDG